MFNYVYKPRLAMFIAMLTMFVNYVFVRYFKYLFSLDFFRLMPIKKKEN